jgi:hypothetical protein
MRKQLPNGGEKRRLAGGEQGCVLTSAMGEKEWEKEASTSLFLFIGRGERAGGSSPARRRHLADGSPEWLDRDARRVPYPRSLTSGPQLE